jgi:FSR family fosmidomycin resistance protein-like MFS transporter
MKYKYNYLLLIGHIATDINQGALPALIPFFVSEYSLSYAKAAGLIFACNLLSSIVQPLFGHLGDRAHKPELICLALILSGTGISLMGFASSYLALFVFAIVSGIGVALFHPEGSKLANVITTEGKATGVAIFSIGGNLGFAIGPLIVVATLALFGMKGLLVFVILTTLTAIIFYANMPGIKAAVAAGEKKTAETKTENSDTKKRKGQHSNRPGAAKNDDRLGAFTLVSFVLFCRSIINMSLNAFIPLVLIHIVGVAKGYGSMALSLYSIVGILGTFSGGFVSDKFGARKTILIGAICISPLLFCFAQNTGLATALVLVFFIAIFHAGPHSTLVVMGQGYLMSRLGLASGIIYGVTVSVGGIASPAIGRIGDVYGLQASIMTLGFVSIISLGLTLLLCHIDKKQVVK